MGAAASRQGINRSPACRPPCTCIRPLSLCLPGRPIAHPRRLGEAERGEEKVPGFSHSIATGYSIALVKEGFPALLAHRPACILHSTAPSMQPASATPARQISGPFPFGREARRRGLSVHIRAHDLANSMPIRPRNGLPQLRDRGALQRVGHCNAGSEGMNTVTGYSTSQCAQVHHRRRQRKSPARYVFAGFLAEYEVRMDTLDTSAVSG
ncbi:hypothetical protein QBC39DRAFT_346895 [Podospora conica]|nr:hypothetical protein QBC39DRAFT_346895 [Schizothecium conicum]